MFCHTKEHDNRISSASQSCLRLAWILLHFQILSLPVAEGLSAVSRLKDAQCAIQMEVGRIRGTAMPPDWAASGAKLSFPLELEFCDDPCAEYEMNKERLLGDDKPSFCAVEVLNDPSFISTNGVEQVTVTPGAFGLMLERIESQQYSFRFFLDFPKGAVRNDVTLPAERIYFLSSCWVKDDAILTRALQTKQQTEQALDNTNQEIDELNGKSSNFFQKSLELRRMTTLIERRSKLRGLLNDIDQAYPLREEFLIEGPNGMLFPKEGTIAVKRFAGAYQSREQYHWVGKFYFKEFFEDEEEEEEES
mmetsp:Transcript_1893/g.2623  ORF Transcript_1893/g.2623 Transcript_1893/m.2623 type:complete len:306 (-) Transcript_1893:87-1004(-)